MGLESLVVVATTLPPVDGLAQYGVLGIIAAAALWAMWHAYQREVKRSDKLEEKLEEANRTMIQDVVPLTTRALDIIDRRLVRRDDKDG